jgi:hypothetical protein
MLFLGGSALRATNVLPVKNYSELFGIFMKYSMKLASTAAM